jgi:hypothetical protein
MTVSAVTGKPFARGARPTPRHRLAAARPHITRAAPSQFALVPKQLSFWGNEQDGDCVTAEEFYAKSCNGYFLPEALAISWAQAHGVLNGAGLDQVMGYMQGDGPVVGSQKYDDGPYTATDYSNEANLQSAIALGPVKLGIDADALPKTAGNGSGWTVLGGSPGQFNNEDHCVGTSGYGPAAYLWQQLIAAGLMPEAPLPGNIANLQSAYILFTWNSIGIVDHPWLMSTCGEAWVRNPTTIGVPPLEPGPTPLPGPNPPAPGASYSVTIPMPTFNRRGLYTGVNTNVTFQVTQAQRAIFADIDWQAVIQDIINGTRLFCSIVPMLSTVGVPPSVIAAIQLACAAVPQQGQAQDYCLDCD